MSGEWQRFADGFVRTWFPDTGDEMTHTYTYTRTQTDLCQRCEHPRDWHRHDDTSRPGENGHNSHGAVLGEQAECPYRCIGYDCTADGPPPADPCDCPDYVPEDR